MLYRATVDLFPPTPSLKDNVPQWTTRNDGNINQIKWNKFILGDSAEGNRDTLTQNSRPHLLQSLPPYCHKDVTVWKEKWNISPLLLDRKIYLELNINT